MSGHAANAFAPAVDAAALADAAPLGFALLAPAWLWLGVAAVVVALWRWRRRPRLPWAGAALSEGEAAMPTTWRARLVALPDALDAFAVVALVLALARPVDRAPAPPTPPGRDLLLCLDVSSSMAANDLDPSRTRHDVGLALAERFVRARPADRIGLVAFARYADLKCPPTRDHEALVEALRALRMTPKEGPEDATAIGAAVGKAAASLQRVDAPAKVVVVVTDGEENVSNKLQPDEIAPLHAAQLCAAAGIRVHTIVVGEGRRGPDGRLLALDTTAVQQLASTTGGRSWRCEDEAALAEVYAQIDALEADALAVPGVVVRERFALALVASLLCAGLARALRGTWLRRLP